MNKETEHRTKCVFCEKPENPKIGLFLYSKWCCEECLTKIGDAYLHDLKRDYDHETKKGVFQK